MSACFRGPKPDTKRGGSSLAKRPGKCAKRCLKKEMLIFGLQHSCMVEKCWDGMFNDFLGCLKALGKIISPSRCCT